MSEATQVVVSGNTTQQSKDTVQPVITLHGDVKTKNTPNDLVVSFNSGKLGTSESSYMEGAMMHVKLGQDIGHYRLDGENVSKETFAENAKKAAKAFINAQLARAFGYNLYKGAKIPRITLAVNGTGKRFAVPKVDDMSVTAYKAAHGEALKKLENDIVGMLLNGAVSLDELFLK